MQREYKLLQMAGESRYQVKPEERLNVSFQSPVQYQLNAACSGPLYPASLGFGSEPGGASSVLS